MTLLRLFIINGLLILCFFFLPSSVLANSKSVETILVTGSHLPVDQGNVTQSVTVIERDQLIKRGVSNALDALRGVSGLQVVSASGSGGESRVSIRSGEANFVLVMIDGVMVNDPTNSRGGSFDFSTIDTSQIERIEILRGAQSAIYGSDALSGVIHIVTRRFDGVQLLTELGNQGQYRYGLTLGIDKDVHRFYFNASTADQGERIRGGSLAYDNFTANWYYQPTDDLSTQVSIRYSDAESKQFPEQSGGSELAVIRERDQLERDSLITAMRTSYRVNGHWRTILDLNHYQQQSDQTSPGISPLTQVPPNMDQTDFKRHNIRWVNQLSVSKRHLINLGVEGQKEQGDSNGVVDFGQAIPTTYQLSRYKTGYFSELRSMWLDNLDTVISVRLDKPSDFDHELSVNVGSKLKLANGVALFVNRAEGYKLPSLFALANPLVGNPDLQPETSDTYELGLSFNSDAFDGVVTLFDTSYQGLVDFDADAFTNVNREEVDISGVEASINVQIADQLLLGVNSSYVDIDVNDSSVNLLGRPQSSWTVFLNWQANQIANYSMQYYWQDQVFDSSLTSGFSTQQKLDSWGRVDLSANWQLSSELNVSMVFENVSNERYYQAIGFPQECRLLRLGFRYGFSE